MTEDELFRLRAPNLDLTDIQEMREEKEERLRQMERRLKDLRIEAEESYHRAKKALEEHRRGSGEESPE